MPARHRHHHSSEQRQSFTITLQSRSRSLGICVHDALETAFTNDRNMHATQRRRLRSTVKQSRLLPVTLAHAALVPALLSQISTITPEMPVARERCRLYFGARDDEEAYSRGQPLRAYAASESKGRGLCVAQRRRCGSQSSMELSEWDGLQGRAPVRGSWPMAERV